MLRLDSIMSNRRAQLHTKINIRVLYWIADQLHSMRYNKRFCIFIYKENNHRYI